MWLWLKHRARCYTYGQTLGYRQGSGGGNKNCGRYCRKKKNTGGNTENYDSGNLIGGNYHGDIDQVEVLLCSLDPTLCLRVQSKLQYQYLVVSLMLQQR
jgi:hypothetical protein